MNDDDRISEAKKLAIKFNLNVEFIMHSQSGKTTNDAEIALGVSPDLIIKTLILIDSKNEKYVGAIVSGVDKLDVKALTRLSASKKLRFATNDEIENLTGFIVGGVPPLALTYCDKYYLDINVFKKGFVIGAGGTEFCGMKFSPQEFARCIPVKIDHVSI